MFGDGGSARGAMKFSKKDSELSSLFGSTGSKGSRESGSAPASDEGVNRTSKIASKIFAPETEAGMFTPPDFIPIADARLCLDCEVICRDNVCPRCAGRSLHPISSWLQAMPALRIERRRGADRRKSQDPNYTGPERRKGPRRRPQ